MSETNEAMITRLATEHDLSEDAVRTAYGALRRGRGRMAQFSHADFGGMAQWSPGMSMVGDLFNDRLKSKLDAVCSDLAAHLAHAPAEAAADPASSGPDVSYRSKTTDENWWPDELGAASSAGAQNDMAYAVFPATQRLAIRHGDGLTVYDTGTHQIYGVAQAQSTDQTLSFTSQDGLVRISELKQISD